MSVQARIPAELQMRLRENPFRRRNRFVLWHGKSLLAETVCKKCDRVLTAMGPDPRFKPLRRELKGVKIRTVILETMVSRLRTPDYDTIEFEMTEKAPAFVPQGDETQDVQPDRVGTHATTICGTCKKALLDGVADLEEVQQLYEADLERMAIEDEENGTKEEQSLRVLTQLQVRKVTSILG